MAPTTKEIIESGKASLGIELGSTRIKAVLIDDANRPIAQGSHTWENQLVDGLWTYSIEAIWFGVQDCYRDLRENVKKEYGVELENLAAIGVSAMMHGFMPFDQNGNILTPFRTWRNTNTGKAASELSELFVYNIPLRWSISHLYQAILDNEPYVGEIDFLTTLAGYIHWQLTGEKILGVGDASGMIPVDPNTKTYDSVMVEKFNKLIEPKGFSWKLEEILPKSLVAGERAGKLTEEGANRLDISGHLKAGIPFCPPEGDAGTGMVATNAVKQRTGNVSAGTSSFSMIVLEKDLSRPYEAIDMVTTPDGSLVAMVHCNNCTSDLNAWVNIFREYTELLGVDLFLLSKGDYNNISSAIYRIELPSLKYEKIADATMAAVTGNTLYVINAPNAKSMSFKKYDLTSKTWSDMLQDSSDILFPSGFAIDPITGHLFIGSYQLSQWGYGDYDVPGFLVEYDANGRKLNRYNDITPGPADIFFSAN